MEHAKLHKCPKCDYPEGLVACPVCHEAAVALEVESILDWNIYPCGMVMLGSGADTYDPICELPKGHEGRCKSSAAIDQHKLPPRDDLGHPWD